MPKLTARMDYLKAVYVRYHKATKSAKGRILDEFCKVCHFHRKHALRLLGRPVPSLERSVGHRRRAFSYGPAVLQAARLIWKASGYLCGQRLKEAIPLWLPALSKRLRLTPVTQEQLLGISARQLDTRLKAHKLSLRRRFYSTTHPGRLLKSMIPIRTFSGDIRVPGYLEIDLVAHCGTALQGDFLYTLTATDIYSGWTDRMAVLGRGQTGIVLALQVLEARLPFRLRGLDSDNGEEFINYHLLAFCRLRRPQIAFTRSRPYKKNDNAHVEQKNFTHVRTFLGWHRWESPEALQVLNDLYAQELLWFQNLFQPSTKLKTKVHIGSKIHRTYDRPQMPLDRLITSGVFHRSKVKALCEIRRRLDPFELSEVVDQKLLNLRNLACSSPAPVLIRRSPAPQALRYFKKSRRHDRMMQKAINGTYFQASLQQQRKQAAAVIKSRQAEILEVVR